MFRQRAEATCRSDVPKRRSLGTCNKRVGMGRSRQWHCGSKRAQRATTTTRVTDRPTLICTLIRCEAIRRPRPDVRSSIFERRGSDQSQI